jgi:hypothetical protein
MDTISNYERPASDRGIHRILRCALAGVCLAAFAGSTTAQSQSAPRLWAAQTGVDQVSLSWDSVAGTKEYRIYLGDPTAPGTLNKRPASVLSASGRGGILTGVQRIVNGITLVAVGADGSVLLRVPFNPIVPATSFPPPTPPAGVTAQAPSASEVTVTWDAVPGATAYFIGRAVYNSGFVVACALCSTDPRYVDRTVSAGLPHTYMVAAIFPTGGSTRVKSNTVTPGAVAPTPSVGPVTDARVLPPSSATAAATAYGVATVTWSPSPTTGLTAYVVKQRLSYSSGAVAWHELARVSPTEQSYTDRSFPSTLLASGTVSAQYEVVATAPSGSASVFSNEIRMQAPTPDPGPTPSPGTGSVPACQLDYQRADNMWAPLGVPNGSLGTETLGLATGQKQAFLTDWKYEKVRNNGTTYYGSHLRIATNRSAGTISLTVRGWVGDIFTGTTLRTYTVGLPPNTSKKFQDDLVDVRCQ